MLEIIGQVKGQFKLPHDLEVLKESMEHLKNDSATLKGLKLGSDDYDFAHNDCKSLINSVKRWLTIEGLLP